MLMGLIEVDREGSYSLKGDPRALYSIMMNIRVEIILMCSSNAFLHSTGFGTFEILEIQ